MCWHVLWPSLVWLTSHLVLLHTHGCCSLAQSTSVPDLAHFYAEGYSWLFQTGLSPALILQVNSERCNLAAEFFKISYCILAQSTSSQPWLMHVLVTPTIHADLVHHLPISPMPAGVSVSQKQAHKSARDSAPIYCSMFWRDPPPGVTLMDASLTMHASQPQPLHAPEGGRWCCLTKASSPMWSGALVNPDIPSIFHSLHHPASFPLPTCKCGGPVCGSTQKSLLLYQIHPP